jgi:bifunctional DNase/RNase
MTHQAMAEVLEALDGKLQDVIVYDLVKRQTDSYYCAYLRIARAGDVINVDVRPSDALTLAVICETPILIDDTVLIAATSAD